MKKLKVSIIICIVLSIVLSSCKSNMSVLKRHYTKGYYFAHSKNKKSVTPIKEEKTPHIAINKPLYALPEKIAEPVIRSNKDLNPTVNAGNIFADNNKNNSKIKNEIMPLTKLKALTITDPIKKIKNKLINKKNIKADAGDRDNLSLFWLIILLLLILWALGLLVGDLGWAINILLVVALILLILWLLRIV